MVQCTVTIFILPIKSHKNSLVIVSFGLDGSWRHICSNCESLLSYSGIVAFSSSTLNTPFMMPYILFCSTQIIPNSLSNITLIYWQMIIAVSSLYLMKVENKLKQMKGPIEYL